MSRKKTRIALLAATVLLVAGVGVFLSIPVSCDLFVDENFEIQVVLGGNTSERGEVSYALWLRHPTPILITGDQGLIRDELLRCGVPESEIIHEPTARTTWENAVFTRPLLEEKGITSAALVTSWFHTSRARGCFERAMPGTRFSTYSDVAPGSPTLDERKVVAIERLKKLYYWATRSIFPW